MTPLTLTSRGKGVQDPSQTIADLYFNWFISVLLGVIITTFLLHFVLWSAFVPASFLFYLTFEIFGLLLAHISRVGALELTIFNLRSQLSDLQEQLSALPLKVPTVSSKVPTVSAEPVVPTVLPASVEGVNRADVHHEVHYGRVEDDEDENEDEQDEDEYGNYSSEYEEHDEDESGSYDQSDDQWTYDDDDEIDSETEERDDKIYYLYLKWWNILVHLYQSKVDVHPKRQLCDRACAFDDYLTFYVGNLSYKATNYDVQRVIEKRLKLEVDQVVVARTSNGESRGCAFVTFRWRKFFEVCDQPWQPLDDNYQSEVIDMVCTILSRESIHGRPVFAELARNQRCWYD